MDLIWAVKGPRACKTDSVLVFCSTLGSQQVIPPIALVKMRTLSEAYAATLENDFRFTDQPLLEHIVVLQSDAIEWMMVRAMLQKLLLLKEWPNYKDPQEVSIWLLKAKLLLEDSKL